MLRVFLLFFILLNSASADYLYQSSNICVKSFWFNQSNGSFSYIRSDTGTTFSGNNKNLGDDFIDGYEYNLTSGRCQKVSANNSIGLANDDYTYYMSLTGLVSGTLVCLGFFLGIKISS